MKENTSRPGQYGLFGLGKNMVSMIVMVLTLCAVSFYLGGAYYGIPENGDGSVVFDRAGCIPLQKVEPFPECNLTTQDVTPCTDPKRWNRYPKLRMAFRERHCPPRSERLQCLIPPPEGYKAPIPWPKSKDECWYKNVPYEWINTVKANQNWLKKQGEKFIFPGGGTMFPNGVSEYVDRLAELVPGIKDGTIRTALDTGCGVASWGGDLLDRGILTMSLAPRDNHEAQVQFALERGVPAMLGIISTQRMPYPSNSFDMAHCSRCLIPWTEFAGVFLMEIDRVLRPGGFWVLSGPPINYQVHWKGWETTEEAEKTLLDKIEKLLGDMCYKRYAMKGDLAVWQKPSDNSCYEDRNEDVYPPMCDDAIEPDASWYVPMRPCIIPQHAGMKALAVGATPLWPERLTTPPDRLRILHGSNAGRFNEDTKLWKDRVAHYKRLVPELKQGAIRNVMDMYTAFGGFAAALNDDPVWVMNVNSPYAPNTLGIVYDRGLIGTYNDWCEAFSTYPRTYDLLHVAGLFSEEGHRCEMKDVMLEMDRILRPGGITIIRDGHAYLEQANLLGTAMRWKCTRHDTEVGPQDSDGLLICRKSFWQSMEVSGGDDE